MPPERPEILDAAARALHEECRRTGARVLSVEADRDASWNRALVAAGFVLHRRKLLVRRDLAAVGAGDPGFAWRSLAEAGEADFLRALDRAATGDPFEDEDRDPEREFRDLLAHAGDRLDPALWRIARLGGAEVGVVLPTALGGEPPEGTLSYVGIHPEHRGRGLGARLHLAGLALLADAGVARYVGSTDVRNAPMARIFARNGCDVRAVQLLFRPAGATSRGRRPSARRPS